MTDSESRGSRGPTGSALVPDWAGNAEPEVGGAKAEKGSDGKLEGSSSAGAQISLFPMAFELQFTD